MSDEGDIAGVRDASDLTGPQGSTVPKTRAEGVTSASQSRGLSLGQGNPVQFEDDTGVIARSQSRELSPRTNNTPVRQQFHQTTESGFEKRCKNFTHWAKVRDFKSFNGTVTDDFDIEEYLDEFEDIASNVNLLAEEKASLIRNYLTGYASRVVRKLSSAELQDFSKIRALLLKTFLPSDRKWERSRAFRERDQLQDETVSKYADELMRLLKLAYPKKDSKVLEDECAERFLAGLLPKIRKHVQFMGDTVSFDELLERAVRIETARKSEDRLRTKGSSKDSKTSVSLAAYSSSSAGVPKALQVQPQRRLRGMSKSPNRSPARPGSPVTYSRDSSPHGFKGPYQTNTNKNPNKTGYGVSDPYLPYQNFQGGNYTGYPTFNLPGYPPLPTAYLPYLNIPGYPPPLPLTAKTMGTANSGTPSTSAASLSDGSSFCKCEHCTHWTKITDANVRTVPRQTARSPTRSVASSTKAIKSVKVPLKKQGPTNVAVKKQASPIVDLNASSASIENDTGEAEQEEGNVDIKSDSESESILGSVQSLGAIYVPPHGDADSPTVCVASSSEELDLSESARTSRRTDVTSHRGRSRSADPVLDAGESLASMTLSTSTSNAEMGIFSCRLIARANNAHTVQFGPVKVNRMIGEPMRTLNELEFACFHLPPIRISCNVGKYSCMPLLDSGAQATLVTRQFVQRALGITIRDDPLDHMLTATRTRIYLYGGINFYIQIQDEYFSVHAHIASELQDEFILGSNFIFAHNIILDLGQGKCQMRGTEVSLQPSVEWARCLQNKRMLSPILSSNRSTVLTCSEVIVPARSETILPGMVYDSRFRVGDTVMFEPTNMVNRASKLFAAPCLASVSTVSTIPCKLLNPTDKAVRLKPGFSLGRLRTVEQIVNQVSMPEGNHKQFRAAISEALDGAHGTARQKSELLDLLDQNADLFALKGEQLAVTHLVTHKIDTGESPPIAKPQFRIPYAHREQLTKLLDDMRADDIVRPSQSPWSAPMFLVKKKGGTFRPVVDFRALNNVTKAQVYPIPRMDEYFDSLGDARYFSTLDLKSGYWQIPMDESSKEKTAFSSPYGHFEFEVMPFGLKNAPAEFQRLMELVLTGLQWNICLVYIDDVIIFSATFDEHLERLAKVFDALRQANLRLKPDKCKFLQKRVTFLGHIISADGIRPDPDKVKALQELPSPRSVRQLQRFLGLVQWFRRFIPRLAQIARPLYSLLKKNVPFKMGDAELDAFLALKKALISPPILRFPVFDDSAIFVLATDASDEALGAMLYQVKRDYSDCWIISYQSCTLNSAERNYSTWEKEALAIVQALRHYRHFLIGRRFILETDHKPLTYVTSYRDASPRIMRWAQELQEFDYEPTHIRGKLNFCADFLSRMVEFYQPVKDAMARIPVGRPRVNPRASSPLVGSRSKDKKVDTKGSTRASSLGTAPGSISVAGIPTGQSTSTGQRSTATSSKPLAKRYQNLGPAIPTRSKGLLANARQSSASESPASSSRATENIPISENAFGRSRKTVRSPIAPKSNSDSSPSVKTTTPLTVKSKETSHSPKGIRYSQSVPLSSNIPSLIPPPPISSPKTILKPQTPKTPQLTTNKPQTPISNQNSKSKLTTPTTPIGPSTVVSPTVSPKAPTVSKDFLLDREQKSPSANDSSAHKTVANESSATSPKIANESSASSPKSESSKCLKLSTQSKASESLAEDETVPEASTREQQTQIDTSMGQQRVDQQTETERVGMSQNVKKGHIRDARDPRFEMALRPKPQYVLPKSKMIEIRDNAESQKSGDKGSKATSEILAGAGSFSGPSISSTKDKDTVEKVRINELYGFMDEIDMSRDQAVDEFCKGIRAQLSKYPNEDDKPLSLAPYSVEDDVLYKEVFYRGETRRVVVVPQKRIPNVIHYFHDTLFGAHLGAARVIDRVRRVYYWPDLAKTIEKWVKSCEICQKGKPQTYQGHIPLKNVTLPEGPFDTISVDCMKLPRTESGCDQVVVFCDYYTRWVEAFAVKNIKATTIVDLLIERIVFRFGVPKVLLSDNGTNFTSKLMTEICSLLRCKKVFISPYHPQANGMVERFNRTLSGKLMSICGQDVRNWDRYLAAVVFAYNTTEHSTTKQSPFYMLYARDPNYSLDKKMFIPRRDTLLTVREYLSRMKRAFNDVAKSVQETTAEQQRRQKLHYDKRTSPKDFKIDDKVLYYKPATGETYKLTPEFDGPFVVTGLPTPETVEIRKVGTSDLPKKVSRTLVKPYYELDLRRRFRKRDETR